MKNSKNNNISTLTYRKRALEHHPGNFKSFKISKLCTEFKSTRTIKNLKLVILA